jgi:hypothetical protein
MGHSSPIRRKFIATSAYIKWTERFQINNLMLHFKLLEKQEQAKSKTSRRTETIKIRAKINEIETKNTIQTINKQKTTKINKSDKPVSNVTKMKREKTQIRKIRNGKGEITTNTKEIHQRLC